MRFGGGACLRRLSRRGRECLLRSLEKKESRPGSVSQDPKERKKKKKSNRFVARTLWQKGNGEKKKGGIIICLFPLLLQWYMPRGKKKKAISIYEEREAIYL